MPNLSGIFKYYPYRKKCLSCPGFITILIMKYSHMTRYHCAITTDRTCNIQCSSMRSLLQENMRIKTQVSGM